MLVNQNADGHYNPQSDPVEEMTPACAPKFICDADRATDGGWFLSQKNNMVLLGDHFLVVVYWDKRQETYKFAVIEKDSDARPMFYPERHDTEFDAMIAAQPALRRTEVWINRRC